MVVCRPEHMSTIEQPTRTGGCPASAEPVTLTRPPAACSSESKAGRAACGPSGPKPETEA